MARRQTSGRHRANIHRADIHRAPDQAGKAVMQSMRRNGGLPRSRAYYVK